MSSRKGHPRRTLSSSPSLHRPRNQSPRRLSSSSPSSPSAIASPTVFRRRLAAATSAAVTASAYSQDGDRKGGADALRWRESFSSAPPQPSLLLSSTASRPLPLRNTTSASIQGDSSFSVVSAGAPSSASAGAVPNPGMVHIRRRVAESKARIQASVALRKQQRQLQRQQEEMYQLWSSSSSSKSNGEASAPATSHAAFGVPDSIVQSQRGGASPTMLALRRTWQPSASETGELATFVSPPSSPSSPGRGSPPLQLSSAPPSPQLNLVNGGVNDHEATSGGGLVAVHPLARQGSPPSQSKRRSSPLVLTPLRTSRSAFSDGELLTLENGFPGGRSSHRRSLESRGSPGSRSPGSRSPPFSSTSNAASGALQDWSQPSSAERPRDLVQVDGGGRRTSVASSEGSSVAGLRSMAGGRTRRRLPPTPGAVAIAEQQADMELAGTGGVSSILQREIVVAPRLPPSPPPALGTPRFNVAVGASMELSRHVLQLGELRVPEEEPSFQWMLARSSGMARSKLGPQSGTCPHRSRLVSRLKELTQAERDCIDVETWGYGRKFAAGSHSPSHDDGAHAAVELMEDPVPLTAMLSDLRGFARDRPVETFRDVAVAGMAGRTLDAACESTVNANRRPTLTEVWDRRAKDQTGTALISSPRGSDQDEDRWQPYTNETGMARSEKVGRRGSAVRGEAGEGSRGGKNVSSAVREAMAALELDGAHFQTLV